LNTFYLYSGSANVNAEFPFGRITAAGLTEHFAVTITTTAWYTDMTILGGTLGFAATIPFGSDTNTAAVSFIGPLGFGRQINRTDTATAIGDTAFSASLGWQQGEHHWNMNLTGVAPTGEYNDSSLAIMGLNRPAVDLKGAYTFLSLETGIEATGALGFTFNAMNTATDYQTGIEMHLEWELAEHLPFGLSAGVGGYLYQQLTGDSGSGAILGPFIGRVASVGPVLSYTIKSGEQQVTLSARWFHEFATEHRVPGDSIFASLGFPL